uniref:Rh7-like protein n=1 Tax=Anax parthenope TaxID=126066 RepID=A0A0C6G514_ANAPR|nr:opsin, rhodopsin-7 like [Anax parthenope]
MTRLWCFLLIATACEAMMAALEEAYEFANISDVRGTTPREEPAANYFIGDEENRTESGYALSTLLATENYSSPVASKASSAGRQEAEDYRDAKSHPKEKDGPSDKTSSSIFESSGIASSTPEEEEEERVKAIRDDFESRWPTSLWRNHGLYTDDYILLINPHWLGFPPPRPISHYILAVLYAIVMIIGVSGNFLVIFMFCRCKSLRTPANILVMNLAVSDCFLLLKMPIFIYNSIFLGPALGAFGCQLYGFLGGLTGTTSIATLAAIALDRYFVVLYPLEPLKVPTRARARACVLLAWAYGAIFSSIPLFGINQYVPEGYLTSCSFDYLSDDRQSRSYILIFFTAAWFVPFTFISFCYAAICRAVALAAAYSSSSTVRAVGKLSDRRDASARRERQRRRTELRLAIVVLGVVALWFISWTPYAVVALLGVTGNRHLVTPLASMIPALFCKMASCVDPFVYAITHPRFRRELARRFSCCAGLAKRSGNGDGRRVATGRDAGRKKHGLNNGRRHRGKGEDEGTSVSEEEVVVMDARGSSMMDASEATSTSGERRNGDSRIDYSHDGPWTTEGRLYRSFPAPGRYRPFASWMSGRKKNIETKDATTIGVEIISLRHPNLSLNDKKNLGKELELTL